MRRLRRTIIALLSFTALIIAAILVFCAVSKNGFWYHFYMGMPLSMLEAFLVIDMTSKALSACFCDKKWRLVYYISIGINAVFIVFSLIPLASEMMLIRFPDTKVLGIPVKVSFVFAIVSFLGTVVLFFITRQDKKKPVSSPEAEKVRYAVRIVIIIQTVIVVISAFIFVSIYHDEPLFVSYSESWIKGKTAAEIEEKYGKFDVKYLREDSEEYSSAYYYVKESKAGGKWWYEIFFDEDGKAYWGDLIATHEDP